MYKEDALASHSHYAKQCIFLYYTVSCPHSHPCLLS